MRIYVHHIAPNLDSPNPCKIAPATTEQLQPEQQAVAAVGTLGDFKLGTT